MLAQSVYPFLVTATYQYYDGILWSELIGKAASDTGFKAKFLRAIGRSKGKEDASEESFINVKSLQASQHKQYRLFTLKFYLTMLNDIVSGQYRSDPRQFIRTAFAICAQIYNCSLFYDNGQHFWFYEEMKQVITVCCVHICT